MDFKRYRSINSTHLHCSFNQRRQNSQMKYFYNDDWVKSCKMHDDNYKAKGNKMLKEYTLAIVVFYAVVSTILGGYVIIMQDDIIAQHEYDLNVSQTAFSISQSNVKRLSHRVDELKTANTALMIELDKKGCIRAIKNTPLPKMIKDKK